jgi:putative Holliday junction resolvase
VARIMGIDYGVKRTGISVTDPDQIIVSPLKTVNTRSLMNFLKIYLSEEPVEKLVFGYPTHRDGNPTYIVEEIEEFKSKLAKQYPTLVFDYQDENFTSAEALSIMISSGMSKKQRQDKSKLDKLSAVLILQRYLNHI